MKADNQPIEPHFNSKNGEFTLAVNKAVFKPEKKLK